MKKMMICAFTFITYNLSAQHAELKLVEEQRNGVKVFQQVGVPNPTSAVSEEQPVSNNLRNQKDLSDYTYGECEDLIRNIAHKIKHLSETEGNENEIRAKKEEIERIKRQMEIIKPN